MNEIPNPETIFREANEVALQKDAQARLLLMDRLAEKASVDPDFRKSLAADPRTIIQHEADKLTAEVGDVTVSPAVVEKVGEAVAKLSVAVPDIESTRVEKLIFGTIEDIRKTFNLSLTLSQVLFYGGFGMVVTAFCSALLSGDKQWIAGLFGASGVGSVLISTFVMNPMDRIQRAAGALVQLQMAYLAYYKQLYLLGGSPKVLAAGEAISYANEIDKMTRALIEIIERPVEVKPKKPGAAPAKPDKDRSRKKKPDQPKVPTAAADDRGG